MRQIILICFLLVIMIFSGCTDRHSNVAEITESKAEEMILEEYACPHGTVEIVSVESKSDKYIIEWEIDPIKEGKDSIDKQTGKMKTIESSHGTCRWK